MKNVYGYEELYFVTSDGVVYSKNYRRTGKSHPLKSSRNGEGYQTVTLWKNGKSKTHKVHLIVLESFKGPRPEGLQGCHNNGNKNDNRLNNLRWDTQSRNFNDDHSLEKHYRSKLSNQDRLEIFKMYSTGDFLQKDIAKMYGVGIMTVSNIVNNRNRIIDRIKERNKKGW